MAARWLHPGRRIHYGYATALGAAAWVAIGGFLNVIGVASRWFLAAILISGLIMVAVMAAGAGRRFALHGGFRKNTLGELAARLLPSRGNFHVWLMIALTAGLMAMVSPTFTFNYHDDFQTYLPRLMRMLDTGSLAGNPFSVLGADSLGAQTFMQGFVVAFLSPYYVNLFDPVLCFLVSGLLIDAIGRIAGAGWLWRLGALAAFVAINPQYANVSALYAGSLATLGLIYAALQILGLQDSDSILGPSIALGLFLAMLVALKFTFAFFVPLFFCLLYLSALLLAKRAVRWIVSLSVAGATALILLSVWWSLYSDKLVMIVGRVVSKLYSGTVASPAPGPHKGVSDLFSLSPIGFGGTSLYYTCLVLLVLAAVAVTLFSLVGRSRQSAAEWGPVVLAAGGAAVASYFILAGLEPMRLVIRYSAPILVVVPGLVTLLVVGHYGTSFGRQGGTTWINGSLGGVLVAVTLLFGYHLPDRAVMASARRSLLRFPMNERYFAYTSTVMSSRMKGYLHRWQRLCPAGRRMFTWIAAPLDLNFARNAILAVDHPGITSGIFPNVPDAGSLFAQLRRHEVECVLWQSRGPGVRAGERASPKERALRRALRALEYRFPEHKEQGGYVFFRLSE